MRTVQRELEERRGDPRQDHGSRPPGQPDLASRDQPPNKGSPRYPLQVLSVFDTRPINAYDFVLSDSIFLGAGEIGSTLMEFPIPQDAVAVLRRIEVKPIPQAYIGAFDGSILGALRATLLRDGSPIPLNTWQWRGPFSGDDLITHHVFAGGSVIGLIWDQSAITYAIPGPTAQFRLDANIFGTILLPRQLPTPFEIASAPTLVDPVN